MILKASTLERSAGRLEGTAPVQAKSKIVGVAVRIPVTLHIQRLVLTMPLYGIHTCRHLERKLGRGLVPTCNHIQNSLILNIKYR